MFLMPFMSEKYYKLLDLLLVMFLPDGSVGKESACNAGDIGDTGLIPGSGRFSGEVNGNPLQYSCLKNPMDRGAWSGIVKRVARVGCD